MGFIQMKTWRIAVTGLLLLFSVICIPAVAGKIDSSLLLENRNCIELF